MFLYQILYKIISIIYSIPKLWFQKGTKISDLLDDKNALFSVQKFIYKGLRYSKGCEKMAILKLFLSFSLFSWTFLTCFALKICFLKLEHFCHQTKSIFPNVWSKLGTF